MTLDDYAALSRKRRASMGLPSWGEPPEPCAGCDCDPVGYAPHNGKGECPQSSEPEFRGWCAYGPCSLEDGHAGDHEPSDPSAKQVGTSPEHANETPESWHVPFPIFAVADGTVLSVDGDTVLIELDDGRHLRWLHMNDIAVTAGDRVVRGQQVGMGLG